MQSNHTAAVGTRREHWKRAHNIVDVRNVEVEDSLIRLEVHGVGNAGSAPIGMRHNARRGRQSQRSSKTTTKIPKIVLRSFKMFVC